MNSSVQSRHISMLEYKYECTVHAGVDENDPSCLSAIVVQENDGCRVVRDPVEIPIVQATDNSQLHVKFIAQEGVLWVHRLCRAGLEAFLLV